LNIELLTKVKAARMIEIKKAQAYKEWKVKQHLLSEQSNKCSSNKK
jgi:hypothetical protein